MYTMLRIGGVLLLLAAHAAAVHVRGSAAQRVLDAPADTGGCPAACNGNGDCVSGACYCYKGYTGAACAQKTCPGDCSGKGTCDSNKGVCACKENYGLKPDCSEAICPVGASGSAAGLTCGGHGNCNVTDRACACFEGWSGAACDAPACPGRTANATSGCLGRGTCSVKTSDTGAVLSAECVCDKPWSGRDCSTKVCDPQCKTVGHGSCINGECVCNAAWRGPNCEFPVCPGALTRRRVVSIDRLTLASSEYYVYAPVPSPSPSPQAAQKSVEQQASDLQNAFSFLQLPSEGGAGVDDLKASMQRILRELQHPGESDPREPALPLAAPAIGAPRFAGALDAATAGAQAEAAAMARLTAMARVEASFKATIDARPLDSSRVTVYCSGRGTCGDDGLCSCGVGWSGVECATPVCPAGGANGSVPCSGHGTCQVNRTASVYDSTASCVCDAGWTGPDCSLRTCPNNCSGPAQGACNTTTGVCACAPGYKEKDCSYKICPGDNGANGGCYGRGKCGGTLPGVCSCSTGYYGSGCEFLQCASPAGAINKGKTSMAGGNGTFAARILSGGTGDAPSLTTSSDASSSSASNVPPGSTPVLLEVAAGVGARGWNESMHSSILQRLSLFNRDHAEMQAVLQLPSEVMYQPCGGDAHGVCHDGTCYCHPDWTGTACHMRTCPRACSNRGVCVAGTCFCASGWGGADGDCSQRVVLHGRLLAASATPSPSVTSSATASAAAPSATASTSASTVAASSTAAAASPAARFAAAPMPAANQAESPLLASALSSLERLAAGAAQPYAGAGMPGLSGLHTDIFLQMDEEWPSNRRPSTGSGTGSSSAAGGSNTAGNSTSGNATTTDAANTGSQKSSSSSSRIFIPVLFVPGVSANGTYTLPAALYRDANTSTAQMNVIVPAPDATAPGGTQVAPQGDVVCDKGWAGTDCSIPVPVCNGIPGTTHQGLASAFARLGINTSAGVDGCGAHGSCTFRGCACEVGWLGSNCEIRVPNFECPVGVHPAVVYDDNGNRRSSDATLSGRDVLLRQFLPSQSPSTSPSASPSAASPVVLPTPTPAAGLLRFRDTGLDGNDQAADGLYDLAIFDMPSRANTRHALAAHPVDPQGDARFVQAYSQSLEAIKENAVSGARAELEVGTNVQSGVAAEQRMETIVRHVIERAQQEAEANERARWHSIAQLEVAAALKAAEEHKALTHDRLPALELNPQAPFSIQDTVLEPGYSLLEVQRRARAQNPDWYKFRAAGQQTLGTQAEEDTSPSATATPSVSGTPSNTATPTSTPSCTPTPSSTSTATATPSPSSTPSSTPTPSITPTASYMPVMYNKGYGTGMVCSGRGVCVLDWSTAAAIASNASLANTTTSANATLAQDSLAAKLSALVLASARSPGWPYDVTAEAAVLDKAQLVDALRAAAQQAAANGGGDAYLGSGTTPLVQVLEQLRVSGVCSCMEGFRGKACEERFVVDGHGVCDARTGKCTCNLVAEQDKPVFKGQSWTGPACAQRTCDGNCGTHGVCDGATGVCSCFPGWGGSRCSQSVCPSECNYHGRCNLVSLDGNSTAAQTSNVSVTAATMVARCSCDRGWGGDDCGTRVCPSACSGNGVCTDNAVCFCKDGWMGDDCSVSVKSGVGAVVVNTTDTQQLSCGGCNGPARGMCVNGACYCNPGYSGVHCEAQQCPNQCSGHGVCNTNTGECTCLPGWSTSDCNTASTTTTDASATSTTTSASPAAASLAPSATS